jgi:hypothetical protein
VPLKEEDVDFLPRLEVLEIYLKDRCPLNLDYVVKAMEF